MWGYSTENPAVPRVERPSEGKREAPPVEGPQQEMTSCIYVEFSTLAKSEVNPS